MSSYLHDIDRTKVPAHVAIVMDGNGRWATQRGLPRTEGHGAGEEALWDTVKGAVEVGVAVADRVRVLHRELVAPAGGGPVPHELQPRTPAASARRAQHDERPDPLHRAQRLARAAKRLEGDRDLRGAHQRQHRHDADDRVQLRRSQGSRRRRQTARPRGAGGHAEALEDRRRGDRVSAVRARHARSGPLDPHERRDAHRPTSCCGSWRTPSCGSRRCSGRTSIASSSTRRSATSRSANGASAA